MTKLVWDNAHNNNSRNVRTGIFFSCWTFRHIWCTCNQKHIQQRRNRNREEDFQSTGRFWTENYWTVKIGRLLLNFFLSSFMSPLVINFGCWHCCNVGGGKLKVNPLGGQSRACRFLYSWWCSCKWTVHQHNQSTFLTNISFHIYIYICSLQ